MFIDSRQNWCMIDQRQLTFRGVTSLQTTLNSWMSHVSDSMANREFSFGGSWTHNGLKASSGQVRDIQRRRKWKFSFVALSCAAASVNYKFTQLLDWLPVHSCNFLPGNLLRVSSAANRYVNLMLSRLGFRRRSELEFWYARIWTYPTRCTHEFMLT